MTEVRQGLGLSLLLVMADIGWPDIDLADLYVADVGDTERREGWFGHDHIVWLWAVEQSRHGLHLIIYVPVQYEMEIQFQERLWQLNGSQ